MMKTPKDLLKKKEELLKETTFKRFVPEIDYSTFESLIHGFAEAIMRKRSNFNEYIVDSENQKHIRYMYDYLLGESASDGLKIIPSRGVFLSGNVGAGKTLLLTAYCNIWNELFHNHKVPYILVKHSSDLANDIIKEGVDPFKKRPLFIDDLGKEVVTAKNYGTVVKPLTELLNLRYDTGAWTFATTNIPLPDLSALYGAHTFDRMREMFNFISMTNKTRRK